MKILVAINYVNYSNEHKKYVQNMALSVLDKNKPLDCSCISFNFRDEKIFVPPSFSVQYLERDSAKIIGNNRQLPYIKEILERCYEGNSDIFGYVNSDILLNRRFFGLLDGKYDAYLFQRVELEEANVNSDIFTAKNFSTKKLFIKQEDHIGFDAMFFDRKWWDKNRKKFHDDLILAEPFWDLYYHKIVVGNSKNVLIDRALYHIYHPTTWSIKSKGAINNNYLLNGGRK